MRPGLLFRLAIEHPESGSNADMFDPDSDVFDLQRSAGSTGASFGGESKGAGGKNRFLDKLRHINA